MSFVFAQVDAYVSDPDNRCKLTWTVYDGAHRRRIIIEDLTSAIIMLWFPLSPFIPPEYLPIVAIGSNTVSTTNNATDYYDQIVSVTRWQVQGKKQAEQLACAAQYSGWKGGIGRVSQLNQAVGVLRCVDAAMPDKNIYARLRTHWRNNPNKHKYPDVALHERHITSRFAKEEKDEDALAQIVHDIIDLNSSTAEHPCLRFGNLRSSNNPECLMFASFFRSQFIRTLPTDYTSLGITIAKSKVPCFVHAKTKPRECCVCRNCWPASRKTVGRSGFVGA